MENSTKMMTEEELKEFFPDFQSGPLDHYRKQATFSWRIMKLVYNNYASIKIKVQNIFMYSYFVTSGCLMLIQFCKPENKSLF